jgi:excisionase family DNA binding protein
MSSRSTEAPNACLDPLVVTPAEARRLLGVGNTYLYQLINAKEIDSYDEGRARRITMASIRARIARCIADGAASKGPQRRRRGRPPKARAGQQPGGQA